MRDLPFSIPESLASYVVQFETDPDKTIRRLKIQLQKRGTDPVGYFLLGWFYHRKEQDDQAIECALKAKIFAPGSPFFDKLHYFFKHPKIFDAWLHHSDYKSLAQTSFRAASTADPILDLNSLIEKLSAVKTRRIKQEDSFSASSESEHSSDSDTTDDIASETLATIHEQQGKFESAIRMYNQLQRRNPEKENYYSKEIDRLKKLQEEQSD